jgi:hypothetical protein
VRPEGSVTNVNTLPKTLVERICGFSWLRPGSDEQDIKIRDLPVPQLPEK